jgi:hypothetical protein
MQIVRDSLTQFANDSKHGVVVEVMSGSVWPAGEVLTWPGHGLGLHSGLTSSCQSGASPQLYADALVPS